MEPVPGTSETFLSQFYCLCSFLDYGCNDKEATRDLARHRNESQDVTDLMDLTWEVREELRAPSVSGKSWGLVNPSESSQALIF